MNLLSNSSDRHWLADTVRFVVCLVIACLIATGINSLSMIEETIAEEPLPKASEEKHVDFNRDIRPLLSDRCFHCHGPAESAREADLRFDTEEGATADLGDYRAIDRKEPAESELLFRIMSEDADERMPPAEINKPLTPEQIELFRRWIHQGAPWADHWAYVSPKRRNLPAVKDKSWPQESLDHFILARLEAEGFQPSPDADRVTLIRRLSFDLRGLPPTPAEVDKFVNSTAPDAYEMLVDRMLGSEQFGERMAMWWLDLVRFSDTVGYHGDQPHRAWPYRDYVIDAFNQNKPFDQFTVEQLAGDLLPEPTQDRIVATCYNRLLQTSHEGGVQLKEYRAIYLADRVRNVSQVWMGATMGCAQCHDHKYDPYTASDFYSMGAFFADIDDEKHVMSGTNNLPTERFPEMPVYSAEERAVTKQNEHQIESLRVELKQLREAAILEQPAWEKEIKSRNEEPKFTETISVDDRLENGGHQRGEWLYVQAEQGPIQSGKRSRRQQSEGLVQHLYEKAKKSQLVKDNDILFAWVYLDPDNPPQAVMLQYFDSKSQWSHRAVWGGDEILHGHKKENWVGYLRRGKLPPSGQWVRLEVPAKDVGFKQGDKIQGMAFTQHGGTVYWDSAGVRHEIALQAGLREALDIAPADRTAKQAKLVREVYLDSLPECLIIQDRIKNHETTIQQIKTSAPRVMFTKALAKPRTVRLLPRGNWLDETGVVVKPAIPEFLGSLKVGERQATRLDLANWLVAPATEGGVGEFTARVQANRFWYLLMGSGIARVLDDFGGQGEPPVHPELLDTLGQEFIDSGWDVKHMMKRIVMSRTYRQSSLTSDALQQVDPLNRLYARQARPRLPAEMIRDNALAISGLLNYKIGGESVKPYQPGGYYRHLNFPTRKYSQNSDSRQWRRGLYVHWQRQFLHPMLKAFDAPSREECTAERPHSNTPVAALTLLNDPTFVEAARSFAERIVREGGKSTGSRFEFAFLQAVSHKPNPQELKTLSNLLDSSQEYYQAHPSDAAKLLTTGLRPADKDIDTTELASWTMIARALLNMNETITRN